MEKNNLNDPLLKEFNVNGALFRVGRAVFLAFMRVPLNPPETKRVTLHVIEGKLDGSQRRG